MAQTLEQAEGLVSYGVPRWRATLRVSDDAADAERWLTAEEQERAGRDVAERRVRELEEQIGGATKAR